MLFALLVLFMTGYLLLDSAIAGTSLSDSLRKVFPKLAGNNAPTSGPR